MMMYKSPITSLAVFVPDLGIFGEANADFIDRSRYNLLCAS